MEQTIHQIKNRFHNKHVLIILNLLMLVFVFSTMQDFLHSRRNNYPFYITESLLFNTFWILFIPMTFVLQKMQTLNPVFYAKASVVAKISSMIALGTIVHMLVYSLTLYVLSALLFKQNYLFITNLGYTLANDFYKYPLVYGAISLFIIQQSKKGSGIEKTDISQVKNQALNKILIQKGRESISISTNEIVSISSCSPYIAIRTMDKKYLHTETLKSMQDKLDENQFVRIHKSSIIQIEKVKSYISRMNGDYDILMNNEDQLRLSRNYVKEFREKMAGRAEL